jgi:hypothetical protein
MKANYSGHTPYEENFDCNVLGRSLWLSGTIRRQMTNSGPYQSANEIPWWAGTAESLHPPILPATP